MAKANKPYPVIVQAILDGAHDDDLDLIVQAAKARTKNLWRKGTRIRLIGTKNPALEGKEGVITGVNARSIAVGLGEVKRHEWGTEYADGEFNVPTHMLEKIVV